MMKNRILKTLSVALCVLLLVGAAPAAGIADFFCVKAAEVYSGTCGDGVSWSLDADTGALTISGSGDMTSSPWYVHTVRSAVIGDDVTSICAYAFHNTNLASVTIGGGVTTIGKGAFYGTSIASVSLSGSLTVIGEDAFHSCNSLQSLTIPNSVQRIDYHAFANCTALSSVTIGGGVQTIADSAFSGCTSLTRVTVGNSLETIGFGAFQNCTSLSQIALPSTVTRIGNNAFYGTAYYENADNWTGGALYLGPYLLKAQMNISGDFTVAEGTRCIAESAFQNCMLLTGVTTPDCLTHIGSRAFASCTKLTQVTLGRNIESIGDSAFEDDALLTQISLPDSLTVLGKSAFKGCVSLECISVPDGVAEIGFRTFDGCTNLAVITLPDSLRHISSYAFTDTAYYANEDNRTGDALYISRHLIDVKTAAAGAFTIADGTLCVADKAFSGCGGLTSVTIPESVVAIGENAFRSCTNLARVTLPNGVDRVEGYTFYGCTNLSNVSIPARVTTIGDYAFCECASLSGVTLPAALTQLGAGAFSKCASLSAVTFPQSLTTIGENAFLSCDSLTAVTIGAGVSYIGEKAFCSCRSLTGVTVDENNAQYASEGGVLYDKQKTKLLQYPAGNPRASFTIPDSVTELSGSAFRGCVCLARVTIPGSVTRIINAFFKCTSLATVTLSDGVEWIDNDAFYGCTGLQRITIPDSVTRIEQYAFYGCTSLQSVTIPPAVTRIDRYAFAECTSLSYVMICDGEVEDDGGAGAIDPGPGLIDGEDIGGDELGGSALVCAGAPRSTAKSGWTFLGEYTFRGCTALQYVHIPYRVNNIDDGVLDGTSAYICSDAADCEAKTYADANGIEFRLCGGHTVHEHSYGSVVTEPTCTMDGATTYMCACGDRYAEPIPALGHDFGAWSVTDDPTVEKRFCARCGVFETRSAQTPTLSLTGGSAYAGDTIEVPVCICYNPGIISVALRLVYDPQVLHLVGVRNGDVFDDGDLEAGGDLNAVPYGMLWMRPLSENNTQNGTLAVFVFEVDLLADTRTTTVSVTYDAVSTFDTDLQLIAFTLQDAAWQIHERAPGDSDGDGELTLLDVAAIKRAVVGGWGVSVVDANADVNRDGSVDLRDAVLIARFLAGGWGVELQ